MNYKETLTSFGLLILRVGFGCFMLFGHGLSKLMNFSDMAENFADPFGLGPETSLGLAVFAEFGCSLLLIIGFLTRLAAIPLAVTMATALFMIHAADPWKVKELAAVYLTVYAVLIVAGGGKFALDRILWNKFRSGKQKEG